MAYPSIDLKEFFLLLNHAISTIGRRSQNEVMQNMAYKLSEWYNVSRDELRDHLMMNGFTLEERCVSCNEDMPDFDGIGDPLCSDCDSEVDSVS